MADIKTLLVFCEGPHDVAFTRHVFKHFFGARRQDWKFSEGTDWSVDHLKAEPDRFGATAANTAAYIWGDDTGKGTLEDIVFPMFENGNEKLLEKAVACVDDCFDWDMNHQNEKRSYAERAKRKKAILTVSGQREKPGGSFTVVLDQARLISKGAFLADDRTKGFAEFLPDWAGLSRSHRPG